MFHQSVPWIILKYKFTNYHYSYRDITKFNIKIIRKSYFIHVTLEQAESLPTPHSITIFIDSLHLKDCNPHFVITCTREQLNARHYYVCIGKVVTIYYKLIFLLHQ